jgi:4,5-dihydroxyphthalate decarboxylase
VSKLRLSLACWNYDRTRGLMDGTIQPAGIDLTYLNLPVEETFFRMLRNREFDVAEMSLSSYTVSMFREPRPFVAIPIFPSRLFRHSSIYINANSGIARRLISSASASARRSSDDGAGVNPRHPLQHYGVPVGSVTIFHRWRGEPGRTEAEARPAGIDRVQPIRRRRRWQRCWRREIRRAPTARIRRRLAAATAGAPPVQNYLEVERDYFRQTGIFPIMHTVVIRADISSATAGSGTDRRSSPRRGAPTKTCTSPPRSRRCCPGSPRMSKRRAR